jgi:hypothetical protein
MFCAMAATGLDITGQPDDLLLLSKNWNNTRRTGRIKFTAMSSVTATKSRYWNRLDGILSALGKPQYMRMLKNTMRFSLIVIIYKSCDSKRRERDDNQTA